VLALLSQDHAPREERWSPWVASALFLALASTGGDAALGAVAYLAAYAIFLDDRPWRTRGWR
jgi:hypothetical protein